MNNKCSLCGDQGSEFYGYSICDVCKADIRLYTDNTIQRQRSNFKKSSRASTYEDDMQYRLQFIERDYIKKKIKLMHILDRLGSMDV